MFLRFKKKMHGASGSQAESGSNCTTAVGFGLTAFVGLLDTESYSNWFNSSSVILSWIKIERRRAQGEGAERSLGSPLH